jgi:hypothetical protein
MNQSTSWARKWASVGLRATRKNNESSQAGVLVCSFDDPNDYPFDEQNFDPEVPEDVETILARQRDSYVDSAKSELAKMFEQQPEAVFYQRQLQVMFEKRYFHWVTVRALSELAQEGVIAIEVLPLQGLSPSTKRAVTDIGSEMRKRL